MIIEDVTQRSPEWERLRLGTVTASEMSRIVTSTGKDSTQADAYMRRKVAEYFTGRSENGYKSSYMEQGTEREPLAREWLQDKLGLAFEVREVGFCWLNSDRLVGASPDCLIYDLDNNLVEGAEIKSPSPGVHLDWLCDGQLPTEHVIQVQANLWVTGLPRWRFISFYPDMPALDIPIQRNESLIADIAHKVTLFATRMKARRELLAEKYPELEAKRLARLTANQVEENLDPLGVLEELA